MKFNHCSKKGSRYRKQAHSPEKVMAALQHDYLKKRSDVHMEERDLSLDQRSEIEDKDYATGESQ